jgi:hypothetical protein
MDPTLQLIMDQLKETKNDIEKKANTSKDKMENNTIATQTKISVGQAKLEERMAGMPEKQMKSVKK